ncbi:ABC transporter ATP-binding protein [Paenibacillus dokdonensis]|uniref:ABC transporter ATP-binding protein n=1 Tax=Paenibacillus dokdonensis TaxID=2567944 RepID=UPI0010A7BD88|nr:ABC transporter ATP-binding protein [Paenibacillus dokdonensis]
MEEIAIEMKGIEKRMRQKTIGPIDLQLPKGYVIGLIGENGSGKSTLIHMMLKIVFPDQGSISWFGENYKQEIPQHVRRQIGFVSEKSSREEDNLTAEEAAEFRAQWYPEWDQTYFEELLGKFKVPRNIKLKNMSKGERRKYEISAALAPRPKLLLLDEPSSGLDPFAWKLMIDELRSYMESGEATMLLSTHIVDEVKRLADYVLLLHHGKMHGMVEKDSLMDNWKEIWVSGGTDLAGDLPGIIQVQQDVQGVVRMITTECLNTEQILQDSGIPVLKTRTLELDEILSLWLKGHLPAGTQTGKGD